MAVAVAVAENYGPERDAWVSKSGEDSEEGAG